MADITAQMASLQSQLAAATGRAPTPYYPPRYGGGRGRGYGRSNRGRGQGRGGRGAPRAHTGGKYCHTHGNCVHTGVECNTPGENHITTATFANMQGGSTLNCG